MKTIFYIFILMGFLQSCQSGKNKASGKKIPALSRVVLRSDTLNVVRLSDTLVIYQSVCRGCEYEQTASFSVYDSLGLVEWFRTESTDQNPPDADGGSIEKQLLMVPRKQGTTVLTLYSFLENPPSAEDSTRITLYEIDIEQ